MKLFTFTFMMIGTMIILNAAGYSPPVGGAVTTLVLDDDASGTGQLQNIQNSGWYIAIIAALTLAAGIGIAAGFITNTPSVNYLIAGVLSLFIGLFIIDSIWMYTKLVEHAATWLVFLATAWFATLIIGFIVSALEWWRGAD